MTILKVNEGHEGLLKEKGLQQKVSWGADRQKEYATQNPKPLSK